MTKDQTMIHTLMRENDELKIEIGRLRNNSIIIPENATNEQVLDAVLPDHSMFLQTFVFTDEWLKKPYIRKRGKEE